MVFAAILIPYEHDYTDIGQLWLIGLNLVFNVLIALKLIYVLEKRRDIPSRWIVLLGSVLIISWGTNSIIEIESVWHLNDGLSNLLKAIALISCSLGAAVALVLFVLRALAIKGTAQLKAANHDIEEHHQAQAALLWEKTRLALTQKVAHVGSWEFEVATKQLIWSDETFRIYGIGSGQSVPTLSELRQTIHPDDRIVWETAVAQLLQGKCCEVEYRILQTDGSIRYLLSQGEPMCDADGQVQTIFGTVLDITARKQAEEALKQSEARFQKLTENLPGVIYQYRQYANGTDAFTYVSPGIRDLLELEPETVLQNTELMWASIHPHDLSTFIASVNLSAQTGRPWCWEWRGITPSGTVKWLRGVARLERQSDGTINWDGILSDISDRKEVEDALFQQERHYRTLAEHCPDIITRFNRELRYVYVNRVFEQVTGIPYPDFIGKTNQEVGMPSEQVVQWNANIQNVFDTAIPACDEFDFPTPSGQRSYQARLVPEYDKDGGVEYVLVVTRDITELKLVEAALQDSENRFRAIFAQAAVGIAQVSLSNQFLQVNQRFCELVGYTESELSLLTCQELNHPDDRELTLEYERQMITGQRQTYSREQRYIHKQGHVEWVNLTVSLVRDAQGVPEYFIKVVEDISERQAALRERNQAEAALRESEQKFHAVFDSVLEGILVVDNEGCIVEANPAACALLNLTKQQIVKRPIWTFTDQQQALKTQNDWQILLARGQMQGEFTLRLTDDSVRELEYGAVANFLPGRHLSVFHDITERKQAELTLRTLSQQEREKAKLLEQALIELQQTQAQLVQNEKMVSLGQLVAGVAHEINNPTSFIYGNIQPALEYAQDLLYLIELYQQHYPKPVVEIAEEIKRIDLGFITFDFPKLLASMKEGASRISQIVLSLKNFSRLDERDQKRVDIHEGLDNTLLILQHRLKQQSHRPEIRIIKDYGALPLVECYPGQLNQVFMNLIHNAIDALEDINQSWVMGHDKESFNSQFPTIRIHTEVVDENCVVIRIADNGPGLTAELQPRIFDPFFTTKPPGKGTGLGLSISYRIVVNKHGGKLTCHSVPGQGAEFAIALPISISQDPTSRASVNSLCLTKTDKYASVDC